jgi:site-specific recombinase XerD
LTDKPSTTASVVVVLGKEAIMTEEYRLIFEKYLEEEKQRGHTVQGLAGLRSRVPKFFKYLIEKDLNMKQIRVKDACDYQAWLIQTGRLDGIKYSVSAINTYLTAATSFYSYLKRNNIVYSNPFLEVRKLRKEFRLPKNILKEKELNTFLTELSKFDNEPDLKNKITRFKVSVIAEVMYATGLRIAEVASLRVNDIDFTRGIINLVTGKGSYPRTCILNEYALNILRLYVQNMRDVVFSEWNKNNGSLFGTGYSNLDKMVNKVLRGVSVKLNYPVVTCHGFRHALGFHLLRSGCDIRYIQAILGHRALKSTEIYTKVEKEDLKDVLDKFHPRQYKEAQNERTDN